MHTSIVALSSILFLSYFSPELSFCQARLNMPRSAFSVALSKLVSPAVAQYFDTTKADSSSPLPDEIQSILITALPADLQRGCPEMVASWGAIADSTAHLSVWEMQGFRQASDSTRFILLAFRCESLAPEYHMKYGDEFPVVLRIKDSSCVLESFPDVQDCGGCSDLTILKLDRTYLLDGNPGFTIQYTSTSDNPCCGGPEAFEQTKLVLYRFDGSRVKEAGSILQHRVDYSEDATNEESPDQETVYDAKISYLEDHGTLDGFTVDAVTSANGKPGSPIHEQYRWDNGLKHFMKTE